MAYPLLRFAGFETPRALYILVASNRISSFCRDFLKKKIFFSTADVISSLRSPQPPYPSVIGRLLPSPLSLRGMIHNQFRLGGSRPFLLHSLGVVIERDSGSFAEWEGIVLC